MYVVPCISTCFHNYIAFALEYVFPLQLWVATRELYITNVHTTVKDPSTQGKGNLVKNVSRA